MDFTSEQLTAINSENKKIIVSAGAGSGKTAVLTQRVVNLVEKNIPISNILVLTFTKAAAFEMKFRIKNKLQNSNSVFAREQAEEIDCANISTLHSFASKVLKQYFYELGIDPAFTVLDDNSSVILKNQALDSVIFNLTQKKDESFFDLVDIFSQNRKDTALRELVVEFQNFFDSLEDVDTFKNMAIKNLSKIDEQNLAVKFLIKEVSERAKFFHQKVVNLIDECKKESADKLLNVLCELEFHLSRVKETNMLAQMKIVASEFSLSSKLYKQTNEELAEKVTILRANTKKFFENMSDIFCVEKSFDHQNEEIIQAQKRLLAVFNLVNEFNQEYSKLKIEMGALDFADLEKYLLMLLKNPKIKLEIIKEIKAVFVDEFQDTNQIQYAIYSEILDNGIFFVGDIKQSIYAFRLAEPEIFLKVREKYIKEGGEVVNLSKNFRSHQDLIAFVNNLFEKIMTLSIGGEDYKNYGVMQKGGDLFPELGGQGLLSRFAPGNFPRVRICAIKKAKQVQERSGNYDLYSIKKHINSNNPKFSSAVAEGKELIKVLKEISNIKIFDPSKQDFRLIQASDIAVLTASRGDYLKTVLATAEKAGYSFSPDISVNIFDDCDMNELLHLMKLILNPKDDISLFVALVGIFGKLSYGELANIKLFIGDKPHFFETIEAFLTCKIVPVNLMSSQKKLKNFYELLNYMRFCSSYMTVCDLIFEIEKKTDFLNLLEEEYDKKIYLLESLKENLLKSKSNNDLELFIWNAENVGFFALDNIAPVHGEAVLNQNDMIRSFQNILVTTIHKSKGLEFPVVILVGAGRPFNRENLTKDILYSKKLGVGISSFNTLERSKSSNLIKNAIKLDLQRRQLEEDIRLLYVALTRAVNNLIIIGIGDPTDQEIKEKNILASNSFFDLISKFFNQKFPPLYVNVVKESFELLCEEKTDEMVAHPIELPKNSQLIEELSQFYEFKYPHENAVNLSQKYSVTELAKGVDEYEVGQLAGESSTEVGNAYHHFMQNVDFSANTKELILKEKAKMLDSGLIAQQELDLIDDEKILKCLNSPLFLVLSNSKRKVLREQQFLMSVPANQVLENCQVEEKILIQGVFDLVIFDKDRILIVDYKTGSNQNTEMFIKKHKKQMQLYQLAASKAFKRPSDVAIYSFYTNEFIRVC